MCSSKVFVDGSIAIDNDGSIQSPTIRCKWRFMWSGIHYLQVEGWSSSASWSFSLTYNGPDTGNKTLAIPPAFNPAAPTNSLPVMKDCIPSQTAGDDAEFIICGFKAASNINLQRVDDFVANYLNVSSISDTSIS